MNDCTALIANRQMARGSCTTQCWAEYGQAGKVSILFRVERDRPAMMFASKGIDELASSSRKILRMALGILALEYIQQRPSLVHRCDVLEDKDIVDQRGKARLAQTLMFVPGHNFSLIPQPYPFCDPADQRRR